MLSADTLSLLVGFVAVVALGYVMRTTGRLPASAAVTLNTLVTEVTMPALILATLAARGVPEAAPRAVIAATAGLAVGFGLAVVIARALRLGGPAEGALALTVGFFNTGFLGISVVLALYPGIAAAGATAVLIDAFVTTLWLYTLGAGWARRRGERREAAPHFTRLLITPASIAVVVGLALSLLGVALPPAVARLATLVGSATIPLVFLALGLRLEWQGLRGRLRPLLLGAVVRLVIAPAFVLVVVLAFDLHGAVRNVAVLQAAMPSAMMGAVVADRSGCDGPLGTGAVVLTTVLGVLTIPIWVAVLHAVPGP